MKNAKERWQAEIIHKATCFGILWRLVREMLPHLPESVREEFTLKFRGVDNAARALYHHTKVNNPDNETNSATQVPNATPTTNGEGPVMPDEEE